MDLRTYRFLENRTYKEIADVVGVHFSYLNQVATGRTLPGPKLAIRIEKATNFMVLRGDLRPDLWPPDTRKLVLIDK